MKLTNPTTFNTALALWVVTVWASGFDRPNAAAAEDLSAAQPGSGWTNCLDPGNTIRLEAASLEIQAQPNTRAHVSRSFDADQVRVSCEMRAAADATPALLTLAWEQGNFIQFGFNSPVTGCLNLREVLGTYPHDWRLTPVAAGAWRRVAIELAEDCIRYCVSDGGEEFQVVHVSPRPERFRGAPGKIALGQDWSGKVFARPTSWVSEPEAGVAGHSDFRRWEIQPLAKARRTASVAERKTIARRERDECGEKELAAAADPSFESVSRYYPALRWSREVVGVEEHPFDIGVAPDGSLQFSEDIASYRKPVAFFEIDGRRLGLGKDSCAKSLLSGWMPVVTASDSQAGLELEETVVGFTEKFSPDAPLYGYVRLRVRNPREAPRRVELSLRLGGVTNTPSPLTWTLDLASGDTQSIAACVPYKPAGSGPMKITEPAFTARLMEVSNHWQTLIARGTRFEVPEARVQNAYRAWLAYNFLNVAKRNGVYEVCDGSGFYGKVYGYSAALYCNALDLMGYPERAATYCESLLSFAHTNGLLAVNFGDTDTGTALWVMGEHYWLTRDSDWALRMVPQMRLMCGWIIGQRQAALARAEKEPVSTRGLIRYRPYADLLHPAADYFSNGYLWKGLDATARLFAALGLKEEAARLRAESDAYRRDLQASMRAAVFEDHGMKILPAIPDTRELWQESDGSADGYYGIIAPCLLEAGVPAWTDPEAGLLVRALEQRGGLTAGVSRLHSMIDHAYTYGYWLNCLQRDDVQRAILGLYGSLAYGMSRDTFAAVECSAIRTGENYWMLPHTYSNTQQLRLLRQLLVREEGDRLWLGQAIPRPWLEPGRRVAVNAAPTTFGPVSYCIEPQPGGVIRVQLAAPTRQSPREIVLRLREPGQRRLARVRLEGSARLDFSGETIRLREARGPITLEAAFK